MMEASSDTISSQTTTLAGSQPLYSLQTFPFSPSPTSLSPTTLESIQSSPLFNSSSHCLDEHNAQCRSHATTSNHDDLTCLSWLHQRGSNLLSLQPLPKINLLSKLPEKPPAFTSADSLSPSSNKPPYSFSSLTFMAIEDSPNKLLPVKGIYEWIINSFPYYGTASGGWRNSVRHNLSLSKSFGRIQRDKCKSVVGKGSLWCVCPEYRASLLEVLRKTPHYHSTYSNLVHMPALWEGADYGTSMVCDSVDIAEELVTIESVEEEGAGEEMEKDPLSDSGYIELHYYQCHQYQYLVLPGEAELDLESVEILQLDADALIRENGIFKASRAASNMGLQVQTNKS